MPTDSLFTTKVVELATSVLGRDMGRAVKAELEQTLDNLGSGIQRKLSAQLLAKELEPDADDLAQYQDKLATLMATKIVARVIVPDLQGKSIREAPATLRDIQQGLSQIDEATLVKMTEKEIGEALQKPAPQPRTQAQSTHSSPAAAPRPRPRPQATQPSSSSGGKYGSSSRSYGGK